MAIYNSSRAFPESAAEVLTVLNQRSPQPVKFSERKIRKFKNNGI